MTKITDKIKKKVLEEKRRQEKEEKEYRQKANPFEKIVKKSVETIFKKELYLSIRITKMVSLG